MTYSVVFVIDTAHVVELVLFGVELFEEELNTRESGL